jgi:DNA-binding transcriptional MerR regulator
MASNTVSSRAVGSAPSADPDERGARKTVFTIGDLAREFDITLRTIRFYEDKGLISPRRRGTVRLYNRRDRARLKLIPLGKKVGFSLSEIGEMLDLYDLKDGQIKQLRFAAEKFGQKIEFLESQRAEIDTALADLGRAREIVYGMLKEREGRGD